MNENGVELLFPMPVLIKSLLQDKEIQVRFLPSSFELNPTIEKTYVFYRMFPTTYKTMKKLFSLFDSQIKKNNDWVALWVSFNIIDESKMLLIFKKEDNAKLKGYLYSNNIRKGNNHRPSELLIQALISG